jgi:hypothetical protein
MTNMDVSVDGFKSKGEERYEQELAGTNQYSPVGTCGAPSMFISMFEC